MSLRQLTRLRCGSRRETCCGILFGITSISVLTLARSFSSKTVFDSDATWRNNHQQVHHPRIMGRRELERVAALRSAIGFRNYLDPILIPRIPGSEGSAVVRKHIIRSLEDLQFEIELDSFTGFPPAPYGPTNFTNIIATSDPRASRRLVLACHYDSKIIEGEDFIGATDSAVSCALLLDIADSLHPFLLNRKYKDVSLQLIFFDGEEAFVEWSEEDSCYGARHLAKKLSNRSNPDSPLLSDLSSIELFILLDLIGAHDVMFHNLFPKKTGTFFARLAEIERDLRRYSLLKSARSAPYFSRKRPSEFMKFGDDHQPFEERGVPVMHLISYPFPRVWHTTEDHVDNLDFDTIDDVNAVLRAFVCEYLNCQI